MKATEQYFSAVLFILLYKEILTFESVDWPLKRKLLNSTFLKLPCSASIQMKADRAVRLSCSSTVYLAAQGGSNFPVTFEAVDEILIVWPFKLMKATEQYFPVVLFIMLYEVVLTFESVDLFIYFTKYLYRNI